ncbi:MocR-like pyridoxine biosynthesis transcription factor PdxR [Aureimonas endophytica]|nr:PLP-dependent aminotransferase family protein [Aureimonas endophytica]
MKRRESPAASFRPAIDRTLTISATRQLYLALRDAIMTGTLRPGHRLPSTRLAMREWGLSRGLVAEAYELLMAEGYAEARHGSGTYVAADLPEALPGAPSIARKAAASPPRRFAPQAERLLRSPGPPERRTLPFAAGRVLHDKRTANLLRRIAARHLDFGSDGYGDPQGLPSLRQGIADYLAASRGVRCTAAQIFVTAGTQQALDLACRVLIAPGDAVLIEDPCYPPARAVFTLNGARLIGLPVDQHGLRIDSFDKAAERPAAVYVTPSHQYPLGATLSLQRRLQLLQLARETGCWIIEDDYDSEFRYEGAAIASLQGLDGDGRVLYAGTFSKALLPSIRLGYLVVPSDLAPAFRAVRPALDVFPPSLPQRIVADYLGEGHFAAHLRRLRESFRASRDDLVGRLKDSLAAHLIADAPEQGIFLTARSTGTWTDDVRLAKAAEAAGVVVVPVSPMHIAAPAKDHLIFGFSGLSRDEAEAGIERLVQVFDQRPASAAPSVRTQRI